MVTPEELAQFFEYRREGQCAEDRLSEHIWELLHRREVPCLREDLKRIPLAEDIHRELCGVREALGRYAAGDLEATPGLGGVLGGYLGELRGKLRELQAGNTEQGGGGVYGCGEEGDGW
jgi:hypothetical protein